MFYQNLKNVLYIAKRALNVLRFGPQPPMLMAFQQPWFQALGIQTILDIGANEGQFASLARKAFPNAKIISFEPLEDCFQTLASRFREDRNFEAFQVAVGAQEGEAEMNRSAFSPSSSLLAMGARHREAFAFTASTTKVCIPMRTLDNLLVERELARPVLMKLDVQGFETQVLRGASKILQRTDQVLLEASLEQLYEGEPLFDDVYSCMKNAGFQLIGVLDSLRDPRTGQPLQIDALFSRSQDSKKSEINTKIALALTNFLSINH